MGLEVNTTTNQILGTSGADVNADGIKINILAYNIVVATDGQTTFTLPFQYIEGNTLEVYANNHLMKRDSDYIVSGNMLTWTSYKLYDTDSLLIWG